MKRDLAKEIWVVENIIRMLNECLVIHTEANQPKNVSAVLKDIELCTKELSKLKALREAERVPLEDARL